MPEEEGKVAPRAEDVFQDVFGASSSGSGEEELLRIGAGFSRQLTSAQIQTLVFMRIIARDTRVNEVLRSTLALVSEWYMDYKQYNQSKEYVMRMFDSVSLRKYINQDAFKINVMK